MANNNFSQQPMKYPSPMQIPQQQNSEMPVPIPPTNQQATSQKSTQYFQKQEAPTTSKPSLNPPIRVETKKENMDDNNHKLKLKKIGVLSLSAYMSLASLIIFLIFAVLLIPLLFVLKAAFPYLENINMGTITIELLLFPIVIAIGTFIFTLVLTAVSNLILKMTKGITIFVEEKE